MISKTIIQKHRLDVKESLREEGDSNSRGQRPMD